VPVREARPRGGPCGEHPAVGAERQGEHAVLVAGERELVAGAGSSRRRAAVTVRAGPFDTEASEDEAPATRPTAGGRFRGRANRLWRLSGDATGATERPEEWCAGSALATGWGPAGRKGGSQTLLRTFGPPATRKVGAVNGRMAGPRGGKSGDRRNMSRASRKCSRAGRAPWPHYGRGPFDIQVLSNFAGCHGRALDPNGLDQRKFWGSVSQEGAELPVTGPNYLLITGI
jgi:hypothetical protein